MPLASEFREHFLKELCTQEGREEVYDNFKAELHLIPFERFAATIIYGSNFFGCLTRIFNHGKPNKNHLLIASLLSKKLLLRVLTTNFDALLEQAVVSQNQDANDLLVLYDEKHFNKLLLNSAKTPIICKIHGGVQDPSSIRTTLDLIAKSELLKARADVLDYFFRTSGKGLLILGYSCSDEFDINPFVQNLHSKTRLLLVNHQDSGFRIEKLKRPFESYRGYQIICNTDEVIDYIWDQFIKTEYVEEKHINQSWKDEISSWIQGLNSAQRLFLAGNILLQLNEPKEANELLSQGLKVVTDRKLRAHILSRLAAVNDLVGNYVQAAKLMRESLPLLEEGKDDIEIAHCYYGLGRIEKLSGNYDEAKNLYIKSLTICRRIDFHVGQGTVLKELGMISYRKGDFENAKRLYTEGLGLQRKSGNLQEIAGCLHQLGQIARIEGDKRKAKTFFSESLDINEKLGDKLNIAGSKHEIALCELKAGNLDKAQTLFEETLKLLEELGEQARIAWTLHDLGTVFVARKEYAKAESLINKSLEIKRLNKDQKGICEGLAQIGVIRMEQRQYDEAEKLLIEALEISKKLEDKKNMKLILTSLESLYKRKRDVRKLYKTIELRVSIFGR